MKLNVTGKKSPEQLRSWYYRNKPERDVACALMPSQTSQSTHQSRRDHHAGHRLAHPKIYNAEPEEMVEVDCRHSPRG